MASEQGKRAESRDLENQQGRHLSIAVPESVNDANLDEYGKLVRYISTYRDTSGAQRLGEGEIIEKRVWYAPWRKRKFRVREVEGGGIPDEWLTTDIRDGLTSSDIETRRRKTGFNELAAEKENLLGKFMSYFQGPILYGKKQNQNCRLLVNLQSNGDCCATCRGFGRLDRLWCHHRYSLPECNCRMVPGKAGCRCRGQSQGGHSHAGYRYSRWQ